MGIHAMETRTTYHGGSAENYPVLGSFQEKKKNCIGQHNFSPAKPKNYEF